MTQTNNRIREEWKEKFDERRLKQAFHCENCEKQVKSFISELLKSQKNMHIKICKDYIEEVGGCDDVKIIMNKIKEKDTN